MRIESVTSLSLEDEGLGGGLGDGESVGELGGVGISCGIGDCGIGNTTRENVVGEPRAAVGKQNDQQRPFPTPARALKGVKILCLCGPTQPTAIVPNRPRQNRPISVLTRRS